MQGDRKGIGQLLSAIAVVLSLLFVGLEVRQNTVAQRAETRQALADASRGFMENLVQDAALWEAWAVRWYWSDARFNNVEVPTLTPLDSMKAEIAMRGALRNAENVYLQYREGAIDRSALGTYGFAGGIWDSPQFREYWATECSAWDTAFVSAFEEMNSISPCGGAP